MQKGWKTAPRGGQYLQKPLPGDRRPPSLEISHNLIRGDILNEKFIREKPEITIVWQGSIIAKKYRS